MLDRDPVFEDGVAIEVARSEPSLVVFDDYGRCDKADADRQFHAAVDLVDDVVALAHRRLVRLSHFEIDE